MSGLEERILTLVKELEEEKRLADKRAKQLYLAAGGGSFISHADTPAAYAGGAGKFVKVNAVPDALIFASLVKADITDTPWAWTDVSKTGSNLTDLATRQHAGLTDVTESQHHNKLHSMTGVQHSAAGLTIGHVLRATGAATFAWAQLQHSDLGGVTSDLHHPQSHTLASHSTKSHNELSDAPSGAHHPQLHASAHHVAGGDLVNHDSLTGFVAAEHKSLPNTIAQVLSDHTKAGHDALGINADTLDTLHAASFALTTRKLDDFGTPDDNTDLNATTTRHGLLMKLGGGTANFLRSDGTWAAPTPGAHAASHEVGGGDLVNHDSLTGFVADEHIDWTATSDHLQTGGYGIFATGLYSQAAGSSASKRIWAISQATYPNHGLFYVNTPLDSIELRWDNVKIGWILMETGYVKFPRYYLSGSYLSQLAGNDKVMDSDKVDNEHASAIVTKARVDAQACDHGALSGKADDDHSQYYNAARHTKAVHDALGILHSSLGGMTVNDHHAQAHTLASHSTKAHSELSDAPADAHHPQSHTLASHSTKPHSALTDITSGQHHAQLHAAAHHVGGGDLLAFASIPGFSTYINQAVLTSSKPQFAGVNLGGATYYLGSGALPSKLYTLYVNEIYGDVGGVTDPSYTFNGDVDTGIYQGGADNLCFATGGGLRLRLTNILATLSLPLEVADHGAAATDQVVNVCYGTGSPPTASGTTIGTLFVKYTA